MCRSLLELQRAPPLKLAQKMVGDKLLRNLASTKCEKKHCNSEDSVLGAMVGLKTIDFDTDQAVLDITRDRVCYRCKQCRARYPITYGQPLYRSPGHGTHSVSYMFFAWWGYLEGKTSTVVARELNVKHEYVCLWYNMACIIIGEDALRLQGEFVFGELTPATVEVEGDETCFQKFRVKEDEEVKNSDFSRLRPSNS